MAGTEGLTHEQMAQLQAQLGQVRAALSSFLLSSLLPRVPPPPSRATHAHTRTHARVRARTLTHCPCPPPHPQLPVLVMPGSSAVGMDAGQLAAMADMTPEDQQAYLLQVCGCGSCVCGYMCVGCARRGGAARGELAPALAHPAPPSAAHASLSPATAPPPPLPPSRPRSN